MEEASLAKDVECGARQAVDDEKTMLPRGNGDMEKGVSGTSTPVTIDAAEESEQEESFVS